MLLSQICEVFHLVSIYWYSEYSCFYFFFIFFFIIAPKLICDFKTVFVWHLTIFIVNTISFWPITHTSQSLSFPFHSQTRKSMQIVLFHSLFHSINTADSIPRADYRKPVSPKLNEFDQFLNGMICFRVSFHFCSFKFHIRYEALDLSWTSNCVNAMGMCVVRA